MDYERLFKRAKAFGEKNGLGSDAEDFAQECLIKAFEVGAISLEYMFLNYREFHRADKRILSGPTGPISGFRTVSLDAPVDSSDQDSARLGELIGCVDADLGSLGEVSEFEVLLRGIISLVKRRDTRDWALATYREWLIEHVF